MAVADKEIDITRNIRLIEWLKSELLTDLADLFRVLSRGVRKICMRLFLIYFQISFLSAIFWGKG